MEPTATTWNDFDNFVNYFIPKQTIPRLRQFAEVITRFTRINLHLRSQERKADLVNKVAAAFQTMRRNNQTTIYTSVRRECEAIVSSKPQTMPTPTFGNVTANNIARARPNAPYSSALDHSGPSTGWQRGSTSANIYSAREPTLTDWKTSPMWKPVKALTSMEMLPDIMTNENSHTRREKRIHFSLSSDVVEALNKSKSDPRSRPVHQVRLFCASSEYYRPAGMAGPPGVPAPTNRNVPIEYPTNPDVSLDGHMVPFKERGLRGKPGSAPPLDIDRTSRGLVRMAGRMANVIMGHTGPTVSKRKELSKKFWFQIVYCEVTPMEDLLARLEALRPTDPDLELEKLKQRAEEDEDIQVGTSSLSLKDPLSGMRITKPIRSSKCSHLQCFDAKWWLESNRSHPQWLCPHCSKELNFEEIICDGYFLSILRAVPDTFDEVTLEADGAWHTANNQYGSADWLAKHGEEVPAPVSLKRERSPSEDVQDKGKRRAIEILSDSEDEEPAGTPLANGHANGHANGTNGHGRTGSAAATPSRRSTTSAQPAQTAVIDLTLSSDEESEDEQVHFRQPGGASTTRGGAASSGVRPAKLEGPGNAWGTYSAATQRPAAIAAGTAPSSAPAQFGGSSSVRGSEPVSGRAASDLSSLPDTLTAAQILKAAAMFDSYSRSSRPAPKPNNAPSRPTDLDRAALSPNDPHGGLTGVTGAQIVAAADRFQRHHATSPNASVPSSTPGQASVPRIRLTYNNTNSNNTSSPHTSPPRTNYSSAYRPSSSSSSTAPRGRY